MKRLFGADSLQPPHSCKLLHPHSRKHWHQHSQALAHALSPALARTRTQAMAFERARGKHAGPRSRWLQAWYPYSFHLTGKH
eukprot:5517869-Pleurochrysis_carterae.AAC.1